MRNIQISPSVTAKQTAAIAAYLREVTRFPLLNADKEAQLAQAVRQGCSTALEQLVNANLRFVVSIAKNYQNKGLPLCDLISEGNAGLLKAAGRFDETKGFKFISFAVWWIRQAMLLAIAEQGRTIRVPVRQLQKIAHARHFQNKLELTLERTPKLEELAEGLRISPATLRELIDWDHLSISIDAAEATNDQPFLLTCTAPLPDEQTDVAGHHLQLHRWLNILTSRERAVIELLFGLNGKEQMSPGRAARALAITTERVRQLKRHGLQKMRLKAEEDKAR